MTVDNLGAPHVADGLLSLAICKPMIRRGAQVGDYIFGFAGVALGAGRLIYAAVVTEVFVREDYYTKHDNRGDAISGWENGDFFLKEDALYHSDGTGQSSDVGNAPDFNNARVLVSDDFRYFGKNGNCSYASACPKLVERLAALGPGHRVHHSPELWNELQALKERLWKGTPTFTNDASGPVPTLGRPCGGCAGDDDDDFDECRSGS
jgi:Nucleotide modification associated domain 2